MRRGGETRDGAVGQDHVGVQEDDVAGLDCRERPVDGADEAQIAAIDQALEAVLLADCGDRCTEVRGRCGIIHHDDTDGPAGHGLTGERSQARERDLHVVEHGHDDGHAGTGIRD